MTTVYLLESVPVRQLDNNGNPVASARLHTWIAGTTTNLTAYADSAGTVPLSNPVVADSEGFWPAIWLQSAVYDLEARKADDVTVLWTRQSVKSPSVFSDQLRIDLAASGGSTLVGFVQAGGSSIARTLQSKSRDTFSLADWGVMGDDVTDDTARIIGALSEVPAGAVLELRGLVGDIFFTTGITVTRSNITLIGKRTPKPTSDNKALEGGTIFRGTLVIDGDNLHLERFGVDNGITYSNTFKVGVGGNGLVVHSLALSTIRRNITAYDLVGMARIGDFSDPQAAYHAVLLEGLENGVSNNIEGIGGWYGVVLKAANWTFDGLTGRENDAVAVYIKSNTYGPVSNVTGSNVICIAGSSRMFVGLNVQASDAQLDTVTIAGVTTVGGAIGAAVRIEGEVAQPVVDVEITGITARSGASGLSFRGPVYACRLEGIVDKPSGGTGLEIAPNTGGSQPIDVTAAVRINVDPAVSGSNHVSITAGNARVFLERAHVTVGYGAPGNILVTKNTKIGDIFGVLSSDRTEANLLNGWTAFTGGQKCGTQTRYGLTCGYGRVKFSGSTSDTFLQLGAGAFPDSVSQTLSVMGFDGGTSKPVPVSLVMDASGNLSLFPNRAAYTFSWLDLSTLQIAAQLPATSGI